MILWVVRLGSRFIDDASVDRDADSDGNGDRVNVFVALWHKIMFYFI